MRSELEQESELDPKLICTEQALMNYFIIITYNIYVAKKFALSKD
jgi:hypothetical protein